MGASPPNYWEVKLCALLHDPPFKVLGIRAHERAAQELRSSLGLSDSGLDRVREADWLASAADRTVLSREETGEVQWGSGEREEGPAEIFFHPMSSAELLGKPCLHGSQKLRDVLRTNLLHRSLADLQEALSQRLRVVHRRLSGDRRREFLYLWRMLPRLWVESVGIKPGGPAEFSLTHLVPADSRLPDHSIFDHLVTTAAFTVDRPALVMVDIGGVQEFLRQSRRVRDLWASSYLVSSLAMAGIMMVVRELGPDALIYPDLRGDPLVDLYLYSEGVLTDEELTSLWGGGDGLNALVKNLLVPAVPATFLFVAPEERVGELERRVKEAIQSLLKSLGDIVLEEIFGELSSEISFQWRRQLGDGLPYPLQVRVAHVTLEDVREFWSELRERCQGLSDSEVREAVRETLKNLIPTKALGWDESLRDSGSVLDDLTTVLMEDLRHGYVPRPTLFYPVAYSVLAIRVRAEKLAEPFSEHEEPSEEGGLKVSRRCRLCGSRNPLVLPAVGASRAEEGWRELVRQLRQRGSPVGWLLSPEEPLCAVCLIKRAFRRYQILIRLWSRILQRGGAASPRDKLERILRRGVILSELGPLPTLDDIAARPFRSSLEGLPEDLRESIKMKVSEALAAIVRLSDRLAGIPRLSELRLSGLAGVESDAWQILSEIEGDKAVEGEFLSAIRERLERIGIPGSFLYRAKWEAALRDLELLEDVITGDELTNLLRDGREAVKAVLNVLDLLANEMKSRGVARAPSNYVAFIKADGDDMGLWISGRKFAQLGLMIGGRLHPRVVARFRESGASPRVVETHRLMTPSLHRSLSRILAGLARRVFPRLIEEAGGVVFYSGGDDLLAVIPANDPENTPLSVVERIYRVFSAEVVSTEEGLSLGMGRLATLSAGLVISHRLVPMWESLERVRLEEKVAKGEVLEGEEADLREKGRISLTKLSRSLAEERAVLSLREVEVADPRSTCAEPRGGPLEAVERRILELTRGVGGVRLSKNAVRDIEEILGLVDRTVSAAGAVAQENLGIVRLLIHMAIARNIHPSSGKEYEASGVVQELLGLYWRFSSTQGGISVRKALNFNKALRMDLSEVLRGVSG